MFDIGFSEIVVIFGLALVVLGPDKLPKVAATIGRWVGRARAMARQFTDQLQQEANNLKADVHVDLNTKPTEREQPYAAPASPASQAAPATPAASPAPAPPAAPAAPVHAPPADETAVAPQAGHTEHAPAAAAPAPPADTEPAHTDER